ncbi:MAG TPA: hypothetical protein QGI40_01740 [Nitrospinaceae bacterium]|nr:hypothetical protein [Nitrospinaceae bacterium]
MTQLTEKEIRKQSIDYTYKDKLKENTEQLTEQLRESTVVT